MAQPWHMARWAKVQVRRAVCLCCWKRACVVDVVVLEGLEAGIARARRAIVVVHFGEMQQVPAWPVEAFRLPLVLLPLMLDVRTVAVTDFAGLPIQLRRPGSLHCIRVHFSCNCS